MRSHLFNRRAQRERTLKSAHLVVPLSVVLSCASIASGCASRSSQAQHPRLAPEVQILTQEQMETFRRVDPAGIEDGFVAPPEEAIAVFERHLEFLLFREKLARVWPAVKGYLRQYWARERHGKVIIFGNFVCPSILVDPDDEKRSATRPQAPVVVDDAGDCNIVVEFPAEDPLKATF